jgi:hypothetical protein
MRTMLKIARKSAQFKIITMKKVISSIAVVLALCLAACQTESLEDASSVGTSGSVTRFTTYKGFMYTLNSNEVQVFSLAIPEQPKLVHTLLLGFGLETVTVFEDALFIGATDALYIVGLDDPAVPILLSKTERVTLPGGGCDPVVVKEDVAYSTIAVIPNICGNINARSALVVFDVSDRLQPVEADVITLDVPRGLGYSGDHLFVCDEGANVVKVFNITQLLNPQQTAFDITLDAPRDLIASGNRLFVATNTDFVIYDISDISNIRKVAQIKR